MTWSLTARDILRLRGVHSDIIKVVNEAIKIGAPKFTIIEGVRTIERQKQLVASGASKTMKSRHIPTGAPLAGHAVDIAPLDPNGEASWAWPLYYKLAPIIKQAAKNVGVDLEWGGDWRTFKDGPHWQLSWSKYP